MGQRFGTLYLPQDAILGFLSSFFFAVGKEFQKSSARFLRYVYL